MKLFNRQFASNYEKLLTYYPRFYREVLEMEAILKAQGRLADELEDNLEQAYLNSFMDCADEGAVGRLEEFLGLGLNSSRELAERRRLVKSYFMGSGKISASLLAKMLQSIADCGEPDIRLEPFDEAGNNRLLVDFDCRENAAQRLAAVQELFAKKVPAHIPMVIRAITRFTTVFTTPSQFHFAALRLPLHFWNQPNDVTLLNGERRLDGSWRLDHTFRGVELLSIELRTSWQEQSESLKPVAVHLPGLRLANPNRHIWRDVNFTGSVPNQNQARQPETAMQTSWQEQNTLTVSLIKDTMWQLGGDLLLDGSKKLNAAIVKENI